MTEPLKAGASKGQMISRADLAQMLDEYYRERGWDCATGIPTKEKLEELGLAYVAEELGDRGVIGKVVTGKRPGGV